MAELNEDEVTARLQALGKGASEIEAFIGEFYDASLHEGAVDKEHLAGLEKRLSKRTDEQAKLRVRGFQITEEQFAALLEEVQGQNPDGTVPDFDNANDLVTHLVSIFSKS